MMLPRIIKQSHDLQLESFTQDSGNPDLHIRSRWWQNMDISPQNLSHTSQDIQYSRIDHQCFNPCINFIEFYKATCPILWPLVQCYQLQTVVSKDHVYVLVYISDNCYAILLIFSCTGICDKLKRNLSISTYIYLSMGKCWLTSSMHNETVNTGPTRYAKPEKVVNSILEFKAVKRYRIWSKFVFGPGNLTLTQEK